MILRSHWHPGHAPALAPRANNCKVQVSSVRGAGAEGQIKTGGKQRRVT